MRNYLRVRGEYRVLALPRPFKPELPPRARRILGPLRFRWGAGGTTSACAENTYLGGWSKPVMRNYLRVRGEYWLPAQDDLGQMELPPRARRIPGVADACRRLPVNYLRVRGEYSMARCRHGAIAELPPRARRIPGDYRDGIGTNGTTSACAENTPRLKNATPTLWNYLRVRGEYS